MPRITLAERRKHLIMLAIAIIVAMALLLIRADTANASVDDASSVSIAAESVSQITGEDYQDAITTERLMILGMLGLVVLTWFYLRWRPPPDSDDDNENMGVLDRE